MSSKRLRSFQNPFASQLFCGLFHNLYPWQELGKGPRIYLMKTKIPTSTHLPMNFFTIIAQSFF
jgi:hypothetical protein